MASASVLRRATRSRAPGRSGGDTRYPWDGHVVPIDESDDVYSAKLLEGADSEKRVVRRALDGVVGFGPRRFYRAGAPRLGEPPEQMRDGRDSGHLGSGLYFFGLLAPARASADRNDADVYRVVGGPRHPFVTGEPFIDAWKLHDFGKALWCVASDLRDYRALLAERRDLDDKLRHAASDREWDKVYFDIASNKESVKRAADVLSKDLHELGFSGPRLEDFTDVRVYSSPESVKLPPRIAKAVERFQTEGRYHPMTYYMRSLGYDGVVHRNPEQFRSGTIGNIWYPEV